MTDDNFNRLMDTIAGMLFGVGFGMIIGVFLLWAAHVAEDGTVHV